MSIAIEAKEKQLQQIISTYGSLVVAYSGGVDSTLLAAVTQRCLPADKFLLVNINSVFTATLERRFVNWATEHQMPLEIVTLQPLDDPQVKANSQQRCYYCKKLIMRKMLDIAEKRGFAQVADGTNLDDYDDYRPGLQATEELEIKHPFVVAGFTKQDIRQLAHIYKLPNWNAPAAACLASRIAHNTPLSSEKLQQIDQAELFLQQLGFNGCRVRAYGEDAKIECRQVAEFTLAVEQREKITAYFHQLGFVEIMLDLAGYRQGAMNRIDR